MEINTKQILSDWQEELLERIEKVKSKGINPKLAIIVAKDFSKPSSLYVNNKIKKAAELGILVEKVEIEWENREVEDVLRNLFSKINKINHDDDINGVIVQLPFPYISEETIAECLNYKKDVDGFTMMQKHLLEENYKEALAPCTAKGVMRMIKSVDGENLSGKSICIVNRSNLIGKPLFEMALQENMTPIVLHSKTTNTDRMYYMRSSEIVITGCGQRAIFDYMYFGNGTTIIDCSMTPKEGVKGVGDCDKEKILEYSPSCKIASGFGHTGPMTVMALMENVIIACENKLNFKY